MQGVTLLRFHLEQMLMTCHISECSRVNADVGCVVSSDEGLGRADLC